MHRFLIYLAPHTARSSLLLGATLLHVFFLLDNYLYRHLTFSQQGSVTTTIYLRIVIHPMLPQPYRKGPIIREKTALHTTATGLDYVHSIIRP